MTNPEAPAAGSGDVHRTDIQMRFADSDALGHINNASIAAYAEVARLDFLTALGGSVRTVILASLHLEYRRQISLGQRIHVETWVSKLGTSSFRLGQTIFANEERATDVSSVVVYFDYATNRPQRLPAELRTMLGRYERE